jgi:hypothetical protein
MTKKECKGLTPAQLSDEIKEIFNAHVEIVGDPTLKWERLFRFMVMENQRFPLDEPIQGICTDFFSAIHAGEVERFGTTIEAHLRAFGSWFPRYWQNKTQKRAFELLYKVKEDEAPEPVAKAGWNLTSLTLGEIKRAIMTYDQINKAPDRAHGKGAVVHLTGTRNFMARCRESLRRYNEIHEGRNQ